MTGLTTSRAQKLLARLSECPKWWLCSLEGKEFVGRVIGAVSRECGMEEAEILSKKVRPLCEWEQT